jgi:hypothetical protein
VAWSVLAVAYYLSPAINRVASVRNIAREIRSLQIPPQRLEVFNLHRTQVYGLGFYLDHLPAEWLPDDTTASFVAAHESISVDTLKPRARALALFPGQQLRLWALRPFTEPLEHQAATLPAN